MLGLLLVAALSLGAISMARGPGPSWNRIEEREVIGFTNIEELAARLLKGMGSLEGGGRTLWATSFEDGLVEVQIYGTVAEDTTLSFLGAKSAKLTTGAVLGDAARVQKMFLPLENERVGLEIMYSTDEDVQDMQLRIRIDRGAGDVDTAMVRAYVSGATKKLQYGTGADTAPVWNDIADVGIPLHASIFNHFKLVVDPTTRKIVRIIFNGLVYDDLDYAFTTASTVIEPHDSFEVRFVTGEAAAKIAHIDNMIVTGGER